MRKREFKLEWDSLSRECPKWFRDAKLGIYFHFGPYSVPAYDNEWYSTYMYRNEPSHHGNDLKKYHEKKYGRLSEFGYKDFIPMFKAERFDPKEWVDIMEMAGARYGGPVSVHADGFSMWESKINRYNAKEMGPMRDIVGEMASELRSRGMKFIATFHHHWKWGWYSSNDPFADSTEPKNFELYGENLPISAFRQGDEYINYPSPMPTERFCKQWKDEVVEVIDKYSPDLIYFDNRAELIDEKYRREFMDHYYRRADEEGREVVVTYKHRDFPVGTGVEDLECGRMSTVRNFVWQNDDKVEWNSWSHVEDSNYKKPIRIIHSLIDVVSKNGNLLLNIGPKADGTIPIEAVEILREVGKWMKVNGEAIYGTRPYTICGEGPTVVLEGHFTEEKQEDFTSKDIRFTTKGETLYLFAMGEMVEDIVVRNLGKNKYGEIKNIKILGSDEEVSWEQVEDRLVIRGVEEQPFKEAIVFKVV